MTDSEMSEVRGEGLFLWLIASAAWCTVNCQSVYDAVDASVTVASIFGWTVGRWYAINIEGLPDPGPYAP